MTIARKLLVGLAVLLIGAAIGLAATARAARPAPDELIQQLNGQPTRWLMPDGGASGVFTTSDGGTANQTACMLLTGATSLSGKTITPNVLVFVPMQPENFCVQPSSIAPSWDGGCNAVPTDVNYGTPVQVGVPQYITPDVAATRLCFTTDGGSISQPVFFAR